MPEFFEKKYKVRRAARQGYETTLNPLWVKKTGVKGKKIRHLFDGDIYVLVPPGMNVDWNKLKEAVIRV